MLDFEILNVVKSLNVVLKPQETTDLNLLVGSVLTEVY